MTRNRREKHFPKKFVFSAGNLSGGHTRAQVSLSLDSECERFGGMGMNEGYQLRKAAYHLWTFTVSKLISLTGNSIYTFGISLYVLNLTGSAANFALNMICGTVPRALLSPFAGYIVDRYSKKMIVIVSQLLAALSVSGLLLFSLYQGLSLWGIYLTTAALSVFITFNGLAFTSSILNLVDEGRVQRATALNQAVVSLSSVGGPVIAGMLYGAVSMNVFLLIHAISYTVAVLLESTMDFRLFSKGQGEEKHSEGMWKGVVSGLRYLKNHASAWLVVWTALVVNFFTPAILVGFPFILIRQLKMTPEQYGIIEGTFSVGMLLGSLYFTVRKEFQYPLLVARRGLISYSAIISLCTAPLFVSMDGFALMAYYLLLAILYGIAITTINTPVLVMLQKSVDEAYRGRIFGVVETMAQALIPFSMMIYGLLMDYVGSVWTIIPSSLCLLAVTLFMLGPAKMRKIYPGLSGERDFDLRENNKVL